MIRPETIEIDYYGKIEKYFWNKLDNTQSEYGAEWGLRGPHGTTYLLIPCNLYDGWTHRLVAVGQFSGLYNIDTQQGSLSIANDIEINRKCSRPSLLGIDRKISKAKFFSWIEESTK